MNRLTEGQLVALEREATDRARGARVGGGDPRFFDSVLLLVQEVRDTGRLNVAARVLVLDMGSAALGEVE